MKPLIHFLLFCSTLFFSYMTFAVTFEIETNALDAPTPNRIKYEKLTPQILAEFGQPSSIHMLTILKLDEQDRLIGIEQITNPLAIRAESFHPETGEIEETNDFLQEKALLNISLKHQTNVKKVLVFLPQVDENSATWLFLKAFPIHPDPVVGGPFPSSDVIKVIDNGHSENRVDLVFVAEGYTTSEIKRFEEDLSGIIEGFFRAPPLSTYQKHFNVWGVKSISNQSGAGNGSPIDTAFGAHFGCYGIDRLLCVETRKVQQYVGQKLNEEEHDVIVVVVNTTKYGGAGGAVATMSLHSSAVDLALHEVGHTFALLADEYDYGTCNAGPASEANVTNQRSGQKWSHWFDHADNVDSFEGAKYCKQGMFRPTENSMMRTLAQPFYAVNTEQIIRRIYKYTSPIDQVTPEAKAITLEKGRSIRFSSKLLQPSDQTVTAYWELDGSIVSQSLDYTFDGTRMNEGRYQLKLIAKDTTPSVIQDNNQVLKRTKSWTIIHGNDDGDPGDPDDPDNPGCTVPNKPDGLTFSQVTSSGFVLSWNAKQHAVRYDMIRYDWGQKAWVSIGSTENTQLEVSGLHSGQYVYVSGRSFNRCGKASDYAEMQRVWLPRN
ncbi:M64 family metallopeptidase [Algicola sagamiensis]|uniref:M64 family metallopeptidase n=1 Tax=Algicola sagamiensis TaxID=163869 RepID=UPI00037FAAC1|nr:M64 family metallopeptidase [Algicola sagamiensis]